MATASLEDSRVEGLDDRIPHQAIIAPANQRRSVESLGGDYAAVLLGVVELWLSQARPETARSRGVELCGARAYLLDLVGRAVMAALARLLSSGQLRRLRPDHLPVDSAALAQRTGLGYKVAPSTVWQILKDACTWPGSPPTPPVNG